MRQCDGIKQCRRRLCQASKNGEALAMPWAQRADRHCARFCRGADGSESTEAKPAPGLAPLLFHLRQKAQRLPQRGSVGASFPVPALRRSLSECCAASSARALRTDLSFPRSIALASYTRVCSPAQSWRVRRKMWQEFLQLFLKQHFRLVSWLAVFGYGFYFVIRQRVVPRTILTPPCQLVAETIMFPPLA